MKDAILAIYIAVALAVGFSWPVWLILWVMA